MKSFLFLSGVVALGLLAGCAGYQRGSAVPEDYRSINVPAFENRTEYPMAGAIAAQQFLDAIIEDGTFAVKDYDAARLRTQVVLGDLGSRAVRYDRNAVIVPDEYTVTLSAQLYVFDASTGAALINGKRVTATDSALTRNDYQTGMMDALPRVSRKLAQALLAELHGLDVTLPQQPSASAQP